MLTNVSHEYLCAWAREGTFGVVPGAREHGSGGLLARPGSPDSPDWPNPKIDGFPSGKLRQARGFCGSGGSR